MSKNKKQDDAAKAKQQLEDEQPSLSDEDLTLASLKRRFCARVTWLDISIGLALAFIVLGDVARSFADTALFAERIYGFCSAVGYPLLFVTVGYLTDKKDLSWQRTLHLAYRYLVPYLASVAIVLAVTVITTHDEDPLSWIVSLFYGAGGIRGDIPYVGELVEPVGTLWMLPAMFFARTASYVLANIPMITRLLLAGASFIVCAGTSGDVFLPFALQSAGCVLWYITFGMMFREQGIFYRNGWEQSLIATCATIGLVYAVVVAGGWLNTPDYGIAFFPQAAIDMVGSLSACVGFMLLSKIIGELSNGADTWLEWIGRNNITLYCWYSIVVSFKPVLEMSPEFMGFMESFPPVITFIVLCIIVYALTLMFSFTTYKIPFLHVIFNSSVSAPDMLIREAKLNRDKMRLMTRKDMMGKDAVQKREAAEKAREQREKNAKQRPKIRRLD